jgi:hypothetical protein
MQNHHLNNFYLFLLATLHLSSARPDGHEFHHDAYDQQDEILTRSSPPCRRWTSGTECAGDDSVDRPVAPPPTSTDGWFEARRR